jgi:hypothetical protein
MVRVSPSFLALSYPLTTVNPAYKNKGGLKQDDLRRRREEQQVEIRRQKREENISKRRNFLPSTGVDSDDEGQAIWDPPVRLHRGLVRFTPIHTFISLAR